MMTRLALVVLVLLAGVARAQSEPPPDAGVPDAATPVPDAAAPVVDAAPPVVPPVEAGPPPLPDQASGVAVPAETTIGTRLRWIPRVLLFVPRWTFWTIAQPFRLGAWAYEKYSLRARVKGVLFNVDETYGVYPVGAYSTDYGFNAGLRFVHKNLFGHHEHLKLRVNFGGEFQQAYGFEITSGKEGDRIRAGIESRYERRPRERFFGIGNARELPEPPAMPLDPTLADAAISSRFRENLIRVVTRVEVKIAGPFSFRASGALALREFSNADTTTEPIMDRFDTSRLVGYDSGVKNIYVDGELTYDTRRPTSRWQTQAIDAAGWLASVHLGRAKGIDGDPTEFTRYGGEVQHYFDLYRGSRTLALRLLVDGIAGSDGLTDGKISFIDLPRLGGPDYLRGYAQDRFRDRAVVLATAEYTWDLGNYLAGYLFTDAGRTVHTWSQLDTNLDELHVGFGIGVQVHTAKSFILRGQLAFSREGDSFVQLALSPAFGRRERAGRY
ncbi:MAG: BamA/TamA family outer membrane protein [Polyangiales bacterium]